MCYSVLFNYNFNMSNIQKLLKKTEKDKGQKKDDKKQEVDRTVYVGAEAEEEGGRG